MQDSAVGRARLEGEGLKKGAAGPARERGRPRRVRVHMRLVTHSVPRPTEWPTATQACGNMMHPPDGRGVPGSQSI